MVYILLQKYLPLRHFSKTCFLVCYANNPSLEGTFEQCLATIRVITEAVGGRQDQAYDKNELEIPIVRLVLCAGVSIWTYFIAELTHSYQLNENEQLYSQKLGRVSTFMKTSRELEKVCPIYVHIRCIHNNDT